MRAFSLLPIASLALSLVGCADLSAKALDACGNGVVEPQNNEQCDLVVDPKLGPGTECGKPDDTARACHYVCTPGSTAPACPTNWICDPDGVCRFKSGVCGNGMVDSASEDCDATVDPKLGAGTMCGAPDDPARACRYICMRGMDTPKCPAGWGCGADNVCRYGSGTFSEPTPPKDLAVDDIALGDFDGNGYRDVIGFDSVHVRVLYGAADHLYAHELDVNVDVSSGPPAVGDVDGDLVSDVVLPERPGLFVLRGQRDRTLAPVAFSPIAVPLHELFVLPVNLLRSDLVQSPMVVAKGFANDADKFVLLLALADTNGAVPKGCFDLRATCIPDQGHPFSDIAGRIPIANVHDESVTSQIGQADEFVLALKNDDFVRVYTSKVICPTPATCYAKPTLLDHGTIELPGLVALPLGNPAGQAVQIADLDGDGHRDLIVSIVTSSGDPAIAVAYGDGQGSFHDANGVADRASIHRFVVLAANGSSIAPVGELGFPYAIGDLNLDGLEDVAGRVAIDPGMGMPILTENALLNGIDAVMLTLAKDTKTSTVLAVYAVDPPQTWDEAVIGDFNRDGIPDLGAVLHGEQELQILIGAGGGLFNGGRISSTFPPSSLRVGDFDGDLVPDLAFVEDGCPSSTTATSLSVLFGGIDLFQNAPVPMGCLNYIQDLEPAFEDTPPDRTSGLVVVSNKTRDASEPASIAIMRGTSERRMLSPFILSNQGSGQRNNVPAGVAVGRFDASGDDVADLFATSEAPNAIGRAAHPTFWFIKGAGHGEFDASDTSAVALDNPTMSQCPELTSIDFRCFRFAVADLDQMPPAEIVGFDTTEFCDEKPTPRSRLLIIHQMPSPTGGIQVSCERYVLLAERGRADEVLVADLNRDGRPELIARFSGSILVYWNGTSGLTPSDVSTISVVPPPPGTPAGTFRPLGIAALSASNLRALQIAIATNDGVFVSTFDQARLFHTKMASAVPPFESSDPNAPPPTQSLGPTTPWRLLASDMNRDGIDDLVLLENNRVHIYPAVEHAAIGAGP